MGQDYGEVYMTEKRKEKQLDGYQFINEKIVPRRKKKWLKRLGIIVFIVVMAIVFGVVARAAYLLSGDYLKNLLEIEDKRQEVKLSKTTLSEKNSSAPTLSKTPTPKPTSTSMSEKKGIPTEPPSVTPTHVTAAIPEPMMEPEAVPNEESTTKPLTGMTASEGKQPTQTPKLTLGENVTTEPTWIETYLQIYDAIRKVAEEVSTSFVIVEAIEQGVDWFQEVYEKRTKTTGLVLGNDGIDLLILVGTEQLAGANKIDVCFGEEFIPGRIYSMDREYGLAVIAVPLSQISKELMEQIELGVLAEAEDMSVGTPVIALGAPNGYEGSMEFGMITSVGATISVTDGEVASFTTNITEYPEGYGFVVNLEGRILGLITHTHKANPEDGIFTAISLDSIRGVIVKLLNNAEFSYFGIKGENIPKNLKKEYVSEGVYVREVENASPALTAGIKAGDILIEVAETPMDGIRSFAAVMLERSVRESVQVKLLRKAEDGLKEITVDVVLSKKK